MSAGGAPLAGPRRESPASQDLIHRNNCSKPELAPWVYAFKPRLWRFAFPLTGRRFRLVRRAALRLYVILLEHEALRRARGADAR